MTPTLRANSSVLTPKQQSALRCFNREGELNEAMLFEWGICRPRMIANALKDKGLLAFGVWLDDEVGYELNLTPAGLEAAARLAELDA